MANIHIEKHKTIQEKKDSCQPYKKDGNGRAGVNENFIKVYKDHPDPEVKEYYQKKGVIPWEK